MDQLIFSPTDVDLARSPLRASLGDTETFTLGAFNPALTRLPDGRLLLLVRVAEALRQPTWNDQVHCIRWTPDGYTTPGYPTEAINLDDPRIFRFRESGYPTIGLTSISWLLPVILDARGENIEDIRYDLAVEPRGVEQEFGVEDARISQVDGGYVMTACSVSGDRLGTSLYRSPDALHWTYEGLVLDHQNKDMLIFEGRVGGNYLALTRPQGDVYLAPAPGGDSRTGPAIHLASSPDLLHWRPLGRPVLKPQVGGATKLGGGTPPILTAAGWLILYHAVEPSTDVGRYQTFWALLDATDPGRVLHRHEAPLLSAKPALTEHLAELSYLGDVVFTTGIVADGPDYLVASGELDLACRMTRLPASTFQLG